MHPDSSKKDVAKAILQGFQRGNISDLPVAAWWRCMKVWSSEVRSSECSQHFSDPST